MLRFCLKCCILFPNLLFLQNKGNIFPIKRNHNSKELRKIIQKNGE